MIPKVFHWVWIGDEALPEKDLAWMGSWLRYHAGWNGVVWAEYPEKVWPVVASWPRWSVQPLPPLVNQKFYDEIERWVTGRAVLASRSDIVRYEVIARHGGIYLDTDVECFAPIEGVLENVRLFVADEWGPASGNYLFGGVPNHPALWTTVRELGPHLNAHEEGLNACVATGPPYLNSRLQGHPDCVVFPHMLFNPLCAFDDPEQVTSWPAVSLANHHYDGKWYERTKNVPPIEFRSASHLTP